MMQIPFLIKLKVPDPLYLIYYLIKCHYILIFEVFIDRVCRRDWKMSLQKIFLKETPKKILLFFIPSTRGMLLNFFNFFYIQQYSSQKNNNIFSQPSHIFSFFNNIYVSIKINVFQKPYVGLKYLENIFFHCLSNDIILNHRLLEKLFLKIKEIYLRR